MEIHRLQLPGDRLTHRTHCIWRTCGGTQALASGRLSYTSDTQWLGHLWRFTVSKFQGTILCIWHIVFGTFVEVLRIQLPGDHPTHLTQCICRFCGGTQALASGRPTNTSDRLYLAHLWRYTGSSFRETILHIWHTVSGALVVCKSYPSCIVGQVL